MITRNQRLLMLTFKTFTTTAAIILGIVVLFVGSIVLFGNMGLVVAIVFLIILLASFLYSNERLREIERDEEKQEEKVKQDYSRIKRYTQTGRLY
jgi:uncharacterized membrane protein